MRILVWHGYLLRGSGSNVYTANTVRAWRAAGHEVLLMCQEKDVAGLPFVDRWGAFEGDNRTFSTASTGAAPGVGSVTVVTPHIGRILPVYVFDEYEGYDAKLYVDLSDDELTAYTEMNVTAMVSAIESFQPEAIITGHEVMGPEIARRACAVTGTRYIAKLHGSALEYAVKLEERYRNLAREGLSGADTVVGGSNYMLEEAARIVPGWRERGAVVNPGCDVELFRPGSPRELDVPVVGFVGKLIVSKGVHHLLAALGLIDEDELSAVIVGFGSFETQLHALWHALASGDLEDAIAIAERGDGRPLPHLLDFLTGPADPGYLEKTAGIDLRFTGRLEHDALSQVLPGFDVLVVPSVLPEAFGMVAAEAAACGVLPVVPAHSGIGEAGRIIEEALDAPGAITFDPADPVDGIASAVERAIELLDDDREGTVEALSDLARSRWSWDHVAERLLDLASQR